MYLLTGKSPYNYQDDEVVIGRFETETPMVEELKECLEKYLIYATDKHGMGYKGHLFYGKNFSGYTSDVMQAGRYTKEEAIEHCESCHWDIKPVKFMDIIKKSKTLTYCDEEIKGYLLTQPKEK